MRKIVDQVEADLFCGFYETPKLRPIVTTQPDLGGPPGMVEGMGGEIAGRPGF
jgi:hypothetical protein